MKRLLIILSIPIATYIGLKNIDIEQAMFSYVFVYLISYIAGSMIYLELASKFEIDIWNKYGYLLSDKKKEILKKIINKVYILFSFGLFVSLFGLFMSSLEGINKEFIYTTNFMGYLIFFSISSVFCIQFERILNIPIKNN